jgi:hypothetical protein
LAACLRRDRLGWAPPANLQKFYAHRGHSHLLHATRMISRDSSARTVYIGGDGFATLSIAGEAHGEVSDFDDLEVLLMLAIAA